MRRIAIKNLEMVLNFEGPKMAANFQDSILYVWNFESEAPDDFDSGWLEMDLSSAPEAFIKFFEGHLSLRALASHAKLGYGHLSPNGKELIFDDSFRFEPELDDSPCPEITRYFRPTTFYAGNRFQFMFTQFGQVCVAVHLRIMGRPVSRGEYCGEVWHKFLKGLARVWERLCYAQTGYVTLHESFFGGGEAFTTADGDISGVSEKKTTESEIYLTREGDLMRVQHQQHTLWTPMPLFRKLFANLAERILKDQPDLTANEALLRLGSDEMPEPPKVELLKFDTGLDPAGYENVYKFLEHVPNYRYYAAVARMGSGVLGPEELGELLEHVHKLPVSEKRPSPALQSITDAIPVEVHNGNLLNYRQGYLLAAFMLKRLGLSNERAQLDIEAIMADLGLEIVEDNFSPSILALAVWQKANPRIFLNMNAIGTNANLRRSSLAHEFCHVLVDRGGARPFGDLLDTEEQGDGIERRARAFAAEFLLPRATAIAFLKDLGSCDISALAQHFGVSLHLAANQVFNASKEKGLDVPYQWRTIADEVRWQRM